MNNVSCYLIFLTLLKMKIFRKILKVVYHYMNY